ncbi:hypothetical protein P0W64_01620 [Tsukamurella sp. 8F]|uniref:hypothetical protein n=1 Tax=unclassified Tsukamurella TaxID=2633480 RepID=UPI0023B8A750|nr:MULTISPECIES: hypothetical protein [unclassified Tsukamurella]MDF0531063.1 hypothetical protein [Tsukamurella sp. 8J]MDF0585470.1 hypothetical protein [Tsukamurella sp. 8F]
MATTRYERAVQLAMRADKVGSDWFIGGGFFVAPALIAIGKWWPAAMPVAIGVLVTAAILLAVLGVVMACGLTVLARRGASFDKDFWQQVFPQARRIDWPERRPSQRD